jgi:transcriptional regulator with XRE-family HTH domain
LAIAFYNYALYNKSNYWKGGEKLKDAIREARMKKALTQEDVANRMGVTQAAVSQWENGVTVPQTRDILKLSEVLGVSVSELLGEKVTA